MNLFFSFNKRKKDYKNGDIVCIETIDKKTYISVIDNYNTETKIATEQISVVHPNRIEKDECAVLHYNTSTKYSKIRDATKMEKEYILKFLSKLDNVSLN